MCGVASVSMCFFYMWCHFTTPVQARIFLEASFGVHTKKWYFGCMTMTRACSPSWCKETPERQLTPRWMQKKSGLNSYSFTLRRSGFEKPSSASLSSLLYPPDHWIKIPAGLHGVAVLMGHVRYGQRTSPSCTHQRKHWIHHNGTTHCTLTHRIAEGMHTGKSSPIGRVRKEPEHTVAVSLRTLNGEWCETRIPPKY